MVDFQSEIGAPQDRVTLEIAGSVLPNYLNYSVRSGIVQQPSTFTLSLGAGRPNADGMTAGELMRLAEPGKQFTMRIGPTVVKTGIVESRDIPDDSRGTTVSITGRDWLYKLIKNGPVEEIDFGFPTYRELVRKVLDICGYADRNLYSDNEANRKAATRHTRASSKPMTKIVETTSTNIATNASTKVNLQRIVGELGGNWFDFLKSQLKKSGLYLWTTASGDFVLSRPTGTTNPLYRIIRRRGIPREMTGTLSRAFSDNTTSRHARATCYGKGVNGKRGTHKLGEFYEDEEMIARGFTDVLVDHDNDATSPEAAKYIAKRRLADERRGGWSLRYTVSGHTTPSLDSSQMLIWTPDTTVTVIDEDLGDMLGENSKFSQGQDCFLEEVEFARNPITSSKLHVMRKQDLQFLGEY